MDLGNGAQDPKDTGAYNYTQPANPWVYAWLAAVSPFIFWLEIHAYNNASIPEFLLSIPVFAFFIYLILAAFFGAARLEMDGESVRRTLFGCRIACVPWKNAKVIQGFYVRRSRVGLVGAYKVVSRKKVLLFGLVFFEDETEVLAPKLNLISKYFDIPLEQRPDFFGKFERVAAFRFKGESGSEQIFGSIDH